MCLPLLVDAQTIHKHSKHAASQTQSSANSTDTTSANQSGHPGFKFVDAKPAPPVQVSNFTIVAGKNLTPAPPSVALKFTIVNGKDSKPAPAVNPPKQLPKVEKKSP